MTNKKDMLRGKGTSKFHFIMSFVWLIFSVFIGLSLNEVGWNDWHAYLFYFTITAVIFQIIFGINEYVKEKANGEKQTQLQYWTKNRIDDSSFMKYRYDKFQRIDNDIRNLGKQFQLKRQELSKLSQENTLPQVVEKLKNELNEIMSKLDSVKKERNDEIEKLNQHTSNSTNNPSLYDGLIKESDLANNFARLGWRDAENLVGRLFEKKGYSIEVVGKTGDYGIDVEAKKDDSYLGIQVKHWSGNVGTDDVMKTFGGSNKFTKVIIISTKSGFTNQALEFALKEETRYRIELWDDARFKLELRSFLLKI